MRLLLLSDIHGNLNALSSVLAKAENYTLDGCVILGDIIDYGMRSNEVISLLRSVELPILCNIRGNHEDAILNDDYKRFSSPRGVHSAQHTKSMLSKSSFEYLLNELERGGKKELLVDGKKILAVHGSHADEYWKSINIDSDKLSYKQYDYVLSGHSHIPHVFESYYEVNDPKMRNKKKTVFINPGSVGQPRNHNNRAQFAVLDTATGSVVLDNAEYDIDGEQQFFDDSVDVFYKIRLKEGV